MKTAFETKRLLLRELLPSDTEGLFRLDSNPEVHKYLGKKPVTNISQIHDVLANIHQQYLDNGIGRWAVILKETNEFIGWSGLKIEKNANGHERYYDLGYRFIPEFWGKGYAFESATAFVDFGFNEMNLSVINAIADINNQGSRNVLEKCGFKPMNEFIFEGDPHIWYEVKKK
ncbi:N-acetyltransferase [Flavobacterium noncentrifugens]|uniref:Protein N-acetyltransferase, RimJ/RimL family n=1 Tax=Flavobacterium noncentrifugens TaxID=1128970 RepID=A0A1G8VJD9_9FLAO|nr:GNAT family N-acetyltransferase [Flavobacterium noncentrifugens]GEP50534.1 N-acetyltransferase [Flavobacterium noncentrifugens]SDJ66168.1 Protein N-acetyltransferase, RimJ/RimL family [Flavobacterium noncentrifugens]